MGGGLNGYNNLSHLPGILTGTEPLQPYLARIETLTSLLEQTNCYLGNPQKEDASTNLLHAIERVASEHEELETLANLAFVAGLVVSIFCFAALLLFPPTAPIGFMGIVLSVKILITGIAIFGAAGSFGASIAPEVSAHVMPISAKNKEATQEIKQTWICHQNKLEMPDCFIGSR